VIEGLSGDPAFITIILRQNVGSATAYTSRFCGEASSESSKALYSRSPPPPYHPRSSPPSGSRLRHPDVPRIFRASGRRHYDELPPRPQPRRTRFAILAGPRTLTALYQDTRPVVRGVSGICGQERRAVLPPPRITHEAYPAGGYTAGSRLDIGIGETRQF